MRRKRTVKKVTTHAAAGKATRLGRYQIVKHLAQGGMADVLIARTTGIEGFERHVVIKRIRAEQAHDARYVSMFLDEARLAASLHHHNVIQVHDIGEADGEYFFAMEYVHGEDVRALLMRLSERGEQVPLEHALSIMTAAAAGLHHAHEQRGADRAPLGIVHRDVSPANILIGYDGGVKVTDFGIAKAAHRTTQTQSGTLKGKVAYMSPEQCVGEAVDRRSDVFSLGIVLYELVTVRRLFKGANDFLTMTSIVLGHVPPPSGFRADLPPELEEIILKALANKPEDRYATADEMRRALEELAAKLGLRTSSTTLADYMKAVFGERPAPWLDADEPEYELSVDFDGSASGVVRPPSDALAGFALPEGGDTPAPIARAHKRARTVGGSPTIEPVVTPGPAVTADGTALVTPSARAWTASVRELTRRRGWRVGAAAALASSVLAIVVVMTGGGSTPSSRAATRDRTSAPAAPAPAAPAPPTSPARADGPHLAASAPATVGAPASPGAPPAGRAPAPIVSRRAPRPAAVSPTSRPLKKPVRRPKRPGPRPRWNPNKLFPE